MNNFKRALALVATATIVAGGMFAASVHFAPKAFVKQASASCTPGTGSYLVGSYFTDGDQGAGGDDLVVGHNSSDGDGDGDAAGDGTDYINIGVNDNGLIGAYSVLYLYADSCPMASYKIESFVAITANIKENDTASPGTSDDGTIYNYIRTASSYDSSNGLCDVTSPYTHNNVDAATNGSSTLWTGWVMYYTCPLNIDNGLGVGSGVGYEDPSYPESSDTLAFTALDIVI